MERVLIVNADDFGLSKGQNYGIIEACRNGVVTSTTALVNGAAIDHAAQLSRSTPELAVGMHFVLTLGEPLSAMPGLTRDGRLGNGSGSRRKKIACRWKRSPTSWRVSTVVLSNSSAMSRRISTAITMCICSPRFIHRRGLCPRRTCVTH